MRDLNPLQFFRGNATDVVGELPDRKPELTKKPLTKVPSLLFDMEVHTPSIPAQCLLPSITLAETWREGRCLQCCF
jgi:hypothetical protein